MPASSSGFPGLFFSQVARYQDRVALRHNTYGIWKRISWKEYGAGPHGGRRADFPGGAAGGQDFHLRGESPGMAVL